MLNRRNFLKTGLMTGAAVIPNRSGSTPSTQSRRYPRKKMSLHLLASPNRNSSRYRRVWLRLTREHNLGSRRFAAWDRPT